MTRLVVVSPICLYRDGLSAMFTHRRQLEVLASAATVAGAVDACREAGAEPDVVLLDTAGSNVAEQVEALRSSLPRSRVVALTVPSREQELLANVEAGVDGLVTVDATLSDLIATIASAARGEAFCSPSVTAVLIRRLGALARDRAAQDPAASLTAREREIAALIEGGLSNKQIAHRLSIALPTVKNHVHSILGKLGVPGRGEAAALVRTGRA